MTSPVPGYPVSSGYHKTGSHWTACGWHTGQDYAAPAGTTIVAARGGTCRHVDYGSAFGNHQFVIQPGDGTEDFYAHTRTRPPNGMHFIQGSWVAEVGSEGNTTGPHLHFERHSAYGWGCSIMADPMLSHNDGGTPAPPDEEDDMPTPEEIAAAVMNYPISMPDGSTADFWSLVMDTHQRVVRMVGDTMHFPVPMPDGSTADFWSLVMDTHVTAHQIKDQIGGAI